MKSQFVSVMVPLITGQSKNVVMQVTPYDESLCEGCQEHGCVIMPSGEKCIATECPDCALDNLFRDGYGYIIKGEVSLDELIRDEAKYALTPTVWLTSYMNGELNTNILRREHDECNVLAAMELLIDDSSPRGDQEEIASPTLGSLNITTPKVASRARRHTDNIRAMMDSLSLGDRTTEPCDKRNSKRLRTS